MNTVTSKHAVHNALLLAKFELKKTLFSTRGIIGLIAFALVWFVLLWYPIKEASNYLFTEESKSLLTALFQDDLQILHSWSAAEMAMFWLAALYLFPLFNIFICADQFASDRSRGTFRFLTLRASRDTLFFGRITGYLCIQALLLIFTLLATLLLVAYRDPSLLFDAAISGIYIFINIMIILLPFTALMAILSLHANSARQATVFAILLMVGLPIAINMIAHNLPNAIDVLMWFIPGSQISMMINSYGFNNIELTLVPLLQAAVLLFLGRTYMARIAL